MTLEFFDKLDHNINKVITSISKELQELLNDRIVDIFEVQRKFKLFKQISNILGGKYNNLLSDEIISFASLIYDDDNKKSKDSIEDKIKKLGDVDMYNFSVVDIQAYNFINKSKFQIEEEVKDGVSSLLQSVNLDLRKKIDIIANNTSREVAVEAVDISSKNKLLGESIQKATLEINKLFENNNFVTSTVINEKNKTITYKASSLAKQFARQLSNQSSVASVLNSCFEKGYDLVKVSSHNDERLSIFCKKYQGKVYSLSGKNKKYPHFASVIFDGKYKKDSGLFHPYCRHDIKPYIEADEVDFIYD